MSISNIVARQGGVGGMVVCNAPDVCKTPSPAGPVPIPYMIVSFLTTAQRCAMKTQNTSKPIFTFNSRLGMVVGDQPGTLGGVVSNTFGGMCRPITFNPTVHAEGFPVVESGHTFGMNCLGPEGVPNTVGTLVYFE